MNVKSFNLILILITRDKKNVLVLISVQFFAQIQIGAWHNKKNKQGY